METIFDFNVTEAELEYLWITHRTQEEYIKHANDYSRLSDLFILFQLRGNEEKAEYYRNKIKNQKKE